MIMKKRAHFTLGVEIAALILIFVIVLVALGTDKTKNEFDKSEYPKKYEYAVEIASAEFGLPENLIYAVMKAESGFDAEAVSSAGAVGLMQIMPSTYENDIKPTLGLKKSGEEALLNYMINIRSGTYYLAYLYDYCGDLETALAMYNAGIGNVNEWLKDRRYSYNGKKIIADKIPVEETRTYVARVMYYYERYNDIYGKRSASVVEDPIFEKYGVKIKWVTKTDAHGNVIVNELACYAWARHYSEIYPDVDPLLVMAIIKTESDFIANAVSKSGAYGLMQIMPVTYGEIKSGMPTEESFSELLSEPQLAVRCGMYYLQWLHKPSLGLGDSYINIAAAYNGGCGNAAKWLSASGLSQGGVLIADKIPRAETKNYVKKVQANYEYYREYLGTIFANVN